LHAKTSIDLFLYYDITIDMALSMMGMLALKLADDRRNSLPRTRLEKPEKALPYSGTV